MTQQAICLPRTFKEEKNMVFKLWENYPPISWLDPFRVIKANLRFVYSPPLVHDSRRNQGQLSTWLKAASPSLSLLSLRPGSEMSETERAKMALRNKNGINKSKNCINIIETFIRQTAFSKVVTILAKLSWQQGNIIFKNEDRRDKELRLQRTRFIKVYK